MNGHYGDITIDVSSAPYETGFKFNTIPFGGMTIDAENAVRVSSAADIKLTPPANRAVIIGTSGSTPTASASLRGALFFVQSAPGTADLLKVCIKNAADGYEWKTVQIA